MSILNSIIADFYEFKCNPLASEKIFIARIVSLTEGQLVMMINKSSTYPYMSLMFIWFFAGFSITFSHFYYLGLSFSVCFLYKLGACNIKPHLTGSRSHHSRRLEEEFFLFLNALAQGVTPFLIFELSRPLKQTQSPG